MGKIIGAILIITACTGLGLWKSRQYAERVEQLKTVVRICEYIKGEIHFAKTALPEALEQIGEKMEEPFSSFLYSVSETLKTSKGEKISHILEQCAENTLKDFFVKSEDLKEFIHTVGDLSQLDKDMQIHLLERYIREQECKIDILIRELPEKRKLFSSMGILGGIFLVILLYQP